MDSDEVEIMGLKLHSFLSGRYGRFFGTVLIRRHGEEILGDGRGRC